MQKNRIEVSKDGKGKTIYVPLCVFKAGRSSYTISCSDPKYKFKFGTSPEQLQKFRDKIAALFEELVEKRSSSIGV